MIAYCGLSCDSCPVLLATLQADKSVQLKMRKSIAEKCRELYGMDIGAEDIDDCDGCSVASGRLYSGCRNCEIRKCAMQKRIENCGLCAEYACDKLNDIFMHEPETKLRLNEINKAKRN